MTGLATIALGGALASIVLGLRLRQMSERLARAEHEIRGGLGGLYLAVHALSPGDAPVGVTSGLQHHLERATAGVEDLLAARTRTRVCDRRRTVVLEDLVQGVADGWIRTLAGRGRSLVVVPGSGRTHVELDPGRFSQALGNVVANSFEHGDGRIEISTSVVGGRARIEVGDAGGGVPTPIARGRGRGLSIATAAARSCGGDLSFESTRTGARATIDLALGRP